MDKLAFLKRECFLLNIYIIYKKEINSTKILSKIKFEKFERLKVS